MLTGVGQACQLGGGGKLSWSSLGAGPAGPIRFLALPLFLG